MLKPKTIINGFRKCGLFPFTPEAINYKEIMVTETVQKPNNNTIQESHETACVGGNTNYKQILCCIENALPTELLREFRLSDQNWNGDIEHTSLFYFWRKHFDLLNSSNNEGIENIITLGTEEFITLDIENLQDLIDNGIVVEVVDDNTIEARTDFVSTDSIISLDTASVVPIEEVNIITDLPAESSNDDPNFLFNASASDLGNATDTKTVIHNESTIVEKNYLVESAKNNNNIDCNIPDAFKNALFYPGKRSIDKKKRRPKELVPTVVSSSEYMNYLTKKSKAKEDIERQKAEKRIQRVLAKEKKEAEKMEKLNKRIEKKKALEAKKVELAAKKAKLAFEKAEIAATNIENAKTLAYNSQVANRREVKNQDNDPEVRTNGIGYTDTLSYENVHKKRLRKSSPTLSVKKRKTDN